MGLNKLVLSVGILSTVASLTAADVTINMKGFRNAKGQVIVCLWKKADGFPAKVEKADAKQLTPITGTAATVVFKDLEAGVYAFNLIHDENSNGKLDTNFMGIPKEGFGATNNPKPAMRAPNFDEAKVTVPAGGAAYNLEVLY